MVKRAGDLVDDAADVMAALLMHLLHGHRRSDQAHGVDEATLDEVLETLRVHRAMTERARRGGDRCGDGNHAHKKFHRHLDAHPVLGNERMLTAAADLEPERVHADFRDVMNDGQHESAAADHHLLAAEARAHEGDVLR